MKNVLKWIAFLPAAVLAFFVSRFISVFLTRYTIRCFFFFSEPSQIEEFIVQVVASLTASGFFVITGTTVAPSKNEIVGLCLSIFMTIFCALSLGIILSGGGFTWQLLFEYIAMIIAAWVAFIQIRNFN